MSGNMGYREFFRRLEISREAHRLMVDEGAMPAPPKVPGSPLIDWTPRYLAACEAALLRRRNRQTARLRRRVQAFLVVRGEGS